MSNQDKNLSTIILSDELLVIACEHLVKGSEN
jgi:hypothetical protein